MNGTAGFDVPAWTLPVATLVLVTVAVAIFFLWRLLTAHTPKAREAERQHALQRKEQLEEAADKICAQCAEARDTAVPLLATEYSAGDQMSRILEELSEMAKLQEQMAGTIRELSEQTGEHG